jgi:putative peptidoglycan lipid II flippase
VASFAKEKVQAIPAAIQMSRIVLPAQYAFLIGSILLGTLYARKQFLGPSLAPNVYNVGIILGAAVISSTFGLGIVGVAWGAMAGAFVGNLLLPIILMLPQGGSFAPSLDLRAEGVGKFFKLLLPVILGFSLPSVVTIITQYFAAPYGAGSNTVLGLSTNLWQAPLGIFGQSLALGAFPALTQFFAEKRMDLYRDLVGKTLRTVLYLCIPSAVLMAAVAPLLVKIIYGYGRAGSDPGQLELVASCLRVYCIGIPAWCMQPVLMRAFFSLHNTFKPVAIGTAMTAVFVVMCEIVTKASSNILALPWATNLAAVLLVIALMAALQGDVGKIDFAGLGEASAKSTMAALPMGVIAYAGTVAVAPHGKLASIGWFVALAAVSGIAFVGASRMLKIPEAAYLDRALARLKRSGPGDPRGTA